MTLEEFVKRYKNEPLLLDRIERGRVKYENKRGNIKVSAVIETRSDFEFNETPSSLYAETDRITFTIDL